MAILLFVVAAVAAGAIQGLLFPPGPWGFRGEGHWAAFFLNWDLNLLSVLVLFFTFAHGRPEAPGKGSTLRTVVRWLAAVSTVLLAGVLLLFMDSKVAAGLVTIFWVLLWCYGYTALEYLRRIIKTFERAELFKALSLLLTLVFNSVAFSIAFGARGGAITGYWWAVALEFAVAFVVIGVAAFFFGHDTPRGA